MLGRRIVMSLIIRRFRKKDTPNIDPSDFMELKRRGVNYVRDPELQYMRSVTLCCVDKHCISFVVDGEEFEMLYQDLFSSPESEDYCLLLEELGVSFGIQGQTIHFDFSTLEKASLYFFDANETLCLLNSLSLSVARVDGQPWAFIN